MREILHTATRSTPRRPPAPEPQATSLLTLPSPKTTHVRNPPNTARPNDCFIWLDHG